MILLLLVPLLALVSFLVTRSIASPRRVIDLPEKDIYNLDEMSLAEIRKLYEREIGKKPSPSWKREEVIKRLCKEAEKAGKGACFR